MRILFLGAFLVLSALARARFSFIQFDTCKNEYTDGFVMIPSNNKNNNNYYYTHILKVYFIHFFLLSNTEMSVDYSYYGSWPMDALSILTYASGDLYSTN